MSNEHVTPEQRVDVDAWTAAWKAFYDATKELRRLGEIDGDLIEIHVRVKVRGLVRKKAHE